MLAWNFLAGASAGTITTIFFLYVLARFPGFIVYVKEGGAEPDVVVRLATFYQLNVSKFYLVQTEHRIQKCWLPVARFQRIRVMFRFLFTIPLLMIGIDALNEPYPIIANP